MQQHLPTPIEASPSPINNLDMNENAEMCYSPMNLSSLGLIGLETLQLPQQQEFDPDFIDSQENVYRDQINISDSHEGSDLNEGELESEGGEVD